MAKELIASLTEPCEHAEGSPGTLCVRMVEVIGERGLITDRLAKGMMRRVSDNLVATGFRNRIPSAQDGRFHPEKCRHSIERQGGK